MKQEKVDERDENALCVLLEVTCDEEPDVNILASGTAEELKDFLWSYLKEKYSDKEVMIEVDDDDAEELELPEYEQIIKENKLYVESTWVEEWVIGPAMGWEYYVWYQIIEVPQRS